MKEAICMSFPNIPNVTPNISINSNDVVNLLLASIAFEELGLAHIINAEAEKIQCVLGTIPGQNPVVPPTIDNLISINKSVGQTLKTIIKKEMLLEFKLEEILGIPIVHEDIATVTANFDGEILTDSDPAHYHTVNKI